MRIAKPFFFSAGFAVLLVGAMAFALYLQNSAQTRSDSRQPPDAVPWLSVTSQSPLTLTWRPPANRDLAGFMLRLGDDGFPQAIEAGELFADICPSSTHISLDLSERPLPGDHYFSLFAYDREGLASGPAQLRIYCDLDGCISVPDLETLNRVRTHEQAAALRQWYIAQLWADGRLPVRLPDEIAIRGDDRYPEAARIETLRLRMENAVETTAWFFSPAQPDGRLMLFHQGHGADLHEAAGLIRELLRSGYLVLAFNMPLEGGNPPAGQDVQSHNDLVAFDRPLHFFIEPVVTALNYVTAAYNIEHTAMMGISGGGWTTSMAAAIDTRIDAAYSVAGGYPVYIRDQIPGNDGDLEQRSEAFWGKTSYIEMFILAGESRRYTQFFIYRDPCCSQQSYAQTFSPYVAEAVHGLDGSYQAIFDTEAEQHTISQNILTTILEMEKQP